MATSFPCLERGDTRVPYAVLGHFPRYIGIARELGAQFFYIPDEKLTGLTERDVWEQNKRFLQSVISANGRFLLSTNDRKIRAQSWLARELEYLRGNNATLFAIEDNGINLFATMQQSMK